MHAAGIALLVIVSLVLLGGLYLAHRLTQALIPGDPSAEIDPGRSIAVLMVLCLAALAIWFVNPFSALLLVPAVHLWMWVVEPELRPRRAMCLLLLAVGLAPPVLVVLYYASTQSLGPVGVAWNVLLLIAGGHVSLVAALVWSVVLGCSLAAVSIGVRSVRRPRPEDAPVTVRGPITYAGPGSLGGTESALRR
jgi:hypothetical protein